MGETAVAEKEKKPQEKAEKPAPRIEVIEDFCKGCELCVVMCPAHVLAMKADPMRWVGAVVEVVRPEACTRCMLCEVHCPDFAIKVY